MQLVIKLVLRVQGQAVSIACHAVSLCISRLLHFNVSPNAIPTSTSLLLQARAASVAILLVSLALALPVLHASLV